MPVSAVESYPDDAQRQYKMATTDTNALVANSPVLSKFLTVQEHANVVHDDLDNASAIERTAKAAAVPVMSEWSGAPQGETYRERLSNWWRRQFGAQSVQDERRGQQEAEANAILASRRPGVSDDEAWQASRQAIGGMSQIPQIAAERFADSATFGLAAPVDPTRAHSWQASTAGAVGQLGGFIVGPAKGAGALINPAERVAGDSFLKAMSKDVINSAGTLSLATALEKSGHAALDTTSGDHPLRQDSCPFA